MCYAERKVKDMSNPILMQFPLKGEWYSPNTPGSKIPSHGTNRYGTRYAYDFIQVDWTRKGWPAYRVSMMQYLIRGAALEDYYCWGERVYAPCDGMVVVAEDGYAENKKTNLLTDVFKAYKNANYFDPYKDNIQCIAGNYMIIQYAKNVYAALCHLQKDSVQVTVGQYVKAGDYVGNVGHSGNSFAPHLHFQLMDSRDITKANGLPCAFREYEIFIDGLWKEVKDGVPTNRDRIRF